MIEKHCKLIDCWLV